MEVGLVDSEVLEEDGEEASVVLRAALVPPPSARFLQCWTLNEKVQERWKKGEWVDELGAWALE